MLVTKRKWKFLCDVLLMNNSSDIYWILILKNIYGNGLDPSLLCWLFLNGKTCLFCTCFFPLLPCFLLNENEVNLQAR